MSLAAFLWRGAARLLAPGVPFYLRARVARGKELAERLPERFGRGAARPRGRLIWMHAASVGETQSVLPLLAALLARDPALSLLLTTGTVTSASLLERRLAEGMRGRVVHRFVPLDVPGWTRRFVAGWRPDLGVFVESELWPNLIAAAARQGVPLALVNGRISARAARWWRRAPRLSRRLLGAFRLVLAQSEADRLRLAQLGAPDPQCWGNLKDAAPPLPADAAELARLAALIGGRPVWLAASTHPGEEAIAIAAHRQLAAANPGLLTIIVPRHPERGAEVAAAAAGLAVARRGLGEDPGPGVAVYVGDTLGELGLFYRLAACALVGGSLVPHGGQNPLEPARLGCPVLLGPHAWNFAEAVERLRRAGAACFLPAGDEAAAALAVEVSAMLSTPDRARAIAEAATAVAAIEAELPDRIAAALLPLLARAADGADMDRVA